MIWVSAQEVEYQLYPQSGKPQPILIVPPAGAITHIGLIGPEPWLSFHRLVAVIYCLGFEPQPINNEQIQHHRYIEKSPKTASQ
ncbi:hypothetical protein ABLB69_06745 [Xenorhabdus khoisanae]|uniref:hypothetical protein n=1 Tax=Xenorhabdus khoisanae TaxID=880157 RepID=UPI0032B83DEB